MRRNFLATTTLLILLCMLIQIFPILAWDYTDGVTLPDTKFEQFGPRANNLLIKLYFDAETEWDALDTGEIDVTDWPLTQTYYNKFTTPPENAYVDTQFYSGEFGIFLLDINWNNNPYLGNPQDPAYPNPVYPNPCSNLNMRQVLWHLHNKPTWLPIIIGPGFYGDLYTTHGSAYGAFSLPLANPYPYSPTAAIALLESDVYPSDGMPDFPTGDGTYGEPIILRPDGPGTYTIWRAEPLTPNNWETVDESIPNGDTDYVYVFYDDLQDSYSLANPATTFATSIAKVDVVANAKLSLLPTQTADDRLALKLVIEGNSYYGDSHTLTESYETYQSSWSTNPATGSPWTWNDITNLEAGFSSVQVGDLPDEWRVTQLYVVVTYENRYWDLNGNGVYDGGNEYLDIQFAIRNDHYHRYAISEALKTEMQNIGLRVTAYYGPSTLLGDYWFYGKSVHMYTAGWSLGVEPDHTILWHSDFYWHPGFCYNTGYVNDALLDSYALGTWLANTESEALTNCLAFQQRFAAIAAAVPWFEYAASKAVYRTYTGGTGGVPAGDGEDPYRGNYWDGVVNFPGYGLDSFFSFLNMHPRGYDRGSGAMTIRWGFKTDSLKSFNPVYSEWLWEWNVLGLIYDSLLVRNPYSALELIPWQCADYETSIYDHPVYGDSTKVFFTLNPDIHWADGTPLTTADIYFTWVELARTVMGRGLPPPWWYSSVAHILSFTIYDAYNFEVLLDVKSVYATMWVGGNVILPKHIWKPMAEGTVGDVQANAADPDMIGNGPYRFVEYVGQSHVLMTANEPRKTVTTNHIGSSAVYSPTGYTRWFPGHAETYVYDTRRAKVGYEELVEMRSEYTNLWYETTDITTTVEIDDVQIYTDTQAVAFMAQAHYVSLLFAARGIDYGYSWWHKADEIGPLDLWVYHKILYINTVTLLVIDIDGTPIYTHTTTGWVKIHIMRPHVTFRSFYSICTAIPWDYELSWHTRITDISGSTWYDQAATMIRPELLAEGLYAYDFAAYPFKSQLPTPDIKVDIKDVALAAKGFGAYPGHTRWSPIADINDDYKIDIKDIANIATSFGWVG